MGARWTRGWLALAVGFVSQAVACQEAAELPNSPIGASAYSDDVACKTDADCATGEACGGGVCQMKRCSEASYASHSPLGTVGFFAHHRELVAAAGTEVIGYDPDGGAFKRLVGPGFTSQSGAVVDVAGGNLLGARPESVAYVTQGSQMIQVRTGADSVFFSAGFEPIAVAAADLDADEQDDVIAVSADGKVAACNAKTRTCTQTTATPPDVAGGPTGPYTILDVAAGDVDADGYAEALLLTSRKSILVVNLDAAKTGDAPVVERAVPDTTGTLPTTTLTRIAAGDLDGDGRAEVVAVLDGSTGDSLLVLDVKTTGVSATARQTLDTSNGSADVVIGTFGTRSRPELALLRADQSVEMFVAGTGGEISSEYRGPLGVTGVKRLAAVDVTGDSPARKAVGTPRLVEGPVVPIAVLTLPPYSRTHSDGASSVSMGRESSEGTSRGEGTVFSVTAGIGYSQELSFFVKGLEVEVSAHYTQELWREKGTSTTIAKSAEFSIAANPENDGYASGAVVLGCGCYHQYDYQLEDPAHRVGPDADGKVFSLFVPVSADTSVWSTRRYNAMVAALGDAAKGLPKIEIPYQLGQVASYPTEARTLDGQPVAAADMVFTNPPTIRASDIAETSFGLSVGHEETQEETVRTGYGADVSVGVFGVTASGNVDISSGKSYGVSLGETTSFGGSIPPLRNDPKTPEDELALYGYSFSPLVYRHHHGDSSFFVLTYAVGQ